MKNLFHVASLILSFATAAESQPMTFELVGSGGNCAGCEWIRADGDITPETPESFQQMNTYPGLVVALNSNGGDLAAGLELGRMFRERGVATSVELSVHIPSAPAGIHDLVREGARCESACAYAFLGGQSRYLDDGALIGFHQFSDPETLAFAEREISGLELLVATSQDQYVTGLIVEYLIEMGIDIRLYALAAAVGPTDPIRHLTSEEASELRVENSRDVLGEWEVLPFGNGLYAEARTNRTERVVRLFCDGSGTHYLNVVVGKSIAVSADRLRQTYADFANNQIGLSVDGESMAIPVVQVSELQPTGDVVVSLALSPEQAARIARARQILYDYDHYFPPSAVRGEFYQPFQFRTITGNPQAALNTFRLCV
jgi:hypothetical protein